MNYLMLEIEVETVDGKYYKQPNCRIKTTDEGHIMILVKNNQGKWYGVKGKVFIKQFKLRKEFHIHNERRRIPNWLIKLFGVKI